MSQPDVSSLESTPRQNKKQHSAPNDASLESSPSQNLMSSEFFQKFMSGQPLLDVSHSQSFSFNQLKTITEKSNRESFHDSDIGDSQQINNRMLTSNMRLLEEIAKNQKLDAKLHELEGLLQRVIGENKGILNVIEQQQEVIQQKEQENDTLKWEVEKQAKQLAQQALNIKKLQDSNERLQRQVSEVQRKELQPIKRQRAGKPSNSDKKSGEEVEMFKQLLTQADSYPQSLRGKPQAPIPCVVNDIHLNCQFRFTSKATSPDFNRTTTPHTVRQQQQVQDVHNSSSTTNTGLLVDASHNSHVPHSLKVKEGAQQANSVVEVHGRKVSRVDFNDAKKKRKDHESQLETTRTQIEKLKQNLKSMNVIIH